VLGLYVHVPFCISKCSYCDFYSLPGRAESIDAYVNALLIEAQNSQSPHATVLNRHAEPFNQSLVRNKSVKHLVLKGGKLLDSSGTPYLQNDEILSQTLYIGGGTPSLLGARNLTTLLDGLRQTLDMSGLVEATVEANPESATQDFLMAAKAAGVNRISFGVQSLNDGELQSIGRVHNARQAIEAIKLVKSIGFASVSADLIVGLPEQTWTSLKDSLQTVTDLGINHLSMYCLSVEEGTPLAKSVPADLPSDDTQVELFGQARAFLIEHGFSHYEISNFALPGQECLHNLNYWRGGEYVGLGPAAASHLQGKRFRNRPDLDAYLENPTGQTEYVETLGEEDKIAEEAMLRLRLLEEGLTPQEMSGRFNPGAVEMLTKRLDRMVQQGLLHFNNSRYTIPASQILVSNRIFREVLGLESMRTGEKE
jgi:oxygen-independent coproporphyrinogen-3 oxidase